jgi:hypothetical protein
MKPTTGMILSIEGDSNCVDDCIFKVMDDGLDTELSPCSRKYLLRKIARRKYFPK